MFNSVYLVHRNTQKGTIVITLYYLYYMDTKLIKIGNSFGVRIPKSLILQYELSVDIEINPTTDGILIKPKKKARAGWEDQFKAALENKTAPDEELLEGFGDDFTDKEWRW